MTPASILQAGVSSFAFGWAVQIGRPPLDEFGLIRFAEQHQVRIVQLGDNLPVHRRSLEERTAVKRAATDAGIRLELGARGLTAGHFQLYVELCREMGSSLLRFVIDAPGHEPSLADVKALLRDASPVLESAQVKLALENHDRFSARSLRQLTDDVGSPHVGICLDTANSLGAGEGLEHVAEVLLPVVVNVHVKDITIRRLPHLMGFVVQGCPLGAGQLPIRAVLEQLRARGYEGSVVLESWSPPAAADSATVAEELAAAESGIETLKQWLAR